MLYTKVNIVVPDGTENTRQALAANLLRRLVAMLSIPHHCVLIPISSSDLYTFVSADDADLSEYRWNVRMQKGWYPEVRRAIRDSERSTDEKQVNRQINMCRQVLERKLGRPIADGLVCDHINGDPLDNRRCNLREATRTQNQWNSQRHRHKKGSVYKGVFYIPISQRWAATVKEDGKNKHLGYFSSELEAAQAYDIGAKKVYGEFARLNFP